MSTNRPPERAARGPDGRESNPAGGRIRPFLSYQKGARTRGRRPARVSPRQVLQPPGIELMVTSKSPSRRRSRSLVGGAVLAVAAAAALGVIWARGIGP